MTRLPPGFALDAIRSQGADITDAVLPLGRANQSLDDVEIVLTNHVTEIVGVVSDSHGRAVDGAGVVIFPVDSEQRFSRSRFVASSATDRLGRYRFEALPPADYYVAAADRSALNVLRTIDDPDFLESLIAGATRVTLGDAAHVTVAIKIADR